MYTWEGVWNDNIPIFSSLQNININESEKAKEDNKMGKDSVNGLQVIHPGTESNKNKDETKAITESIPIPKNNNATTKEDTS